MEILDTGKQSLSEVKVHSMFGEQKILWRVDLRVYI